jgi:phage tail sheath protein FI
MPVRPTYPGVYVEEISSGVHPVTAVATSTAAFIGTFRKGLLNEAVQLLSMADFEREYGGLDRNSEASYAVQQFFMNGGSEAWVVRVANDGSAVAADIAKVSRIVLNSGTAALLTLTAGRRIRGAGAGNPGAWGNFLRADVGYNDPGDTFNLTISEVRIQGNQTSVVQSETFSNLTTDPAAANNVAAVVNEGSRLVQVAVSGTPSGPVFPRPNPSGTLSKDVSSFGANPTTIVAHLSATGFPTAGVPLVFPAGPAATFAQRYQQALRTAGGDSSIPAGLRAYLTAATVQMISGTTAADRRFIVRLGTGAQPYDPATVITFSGSATDLPMIGMVAPPAAALNPQQFAPTTAANQGSDGLTVNASGTYVIPPSAIRGSALTKTGIYALDDVDLFNILAIPDAPRLPAGDAQSIYAEATLYAESRRAMLLIDIPADVDQVDEMQNWMTANDMLRHPNTAVYFPRTFVADPLNQNRPRSFAASGTIAGLWARTDAQRGVWKAPAGTDARLRGVESLARLMTDGENGLLNPLGINCLRNFPIYSNICWGARTLQGADQLASEWKYVPVRRTTLFIEESLYRGTKWVVFEPNDEPLWAQIRLNVGAFMQDLFRKGAFQGTNPKDAYFVRCDGTTTTQTDIDNGIVNIEVGFAPLKPAEFVILKISQIARQTGA